MAEKPPFFFDKGMLLAVSLRERIYVTISSKYYGIDVYVTYKGDKIL